MSAAVGRKLELATVELVLSEAAERYAVLVLEGEAGIGKTTVWREATRLGLERGFRVLGCRPAQAEAKLAFASLADLLAPVEDDVLSELPEPQRVALEIALLRTRPRRATSDPRAAATALLSVLDRLAETSPLVVAIDDAQWLDPASGAALSFALRRIPPERPVGLVVSVRVEPGEAADVLGIGRLPAGRIERIRLGPLDLRALFHVIESQLGVVFPRPTLQRVEQASAGNPLFALELARALRESGELPGRGDPLPIPEALADLLDARVASLPARARKVLLANALVSEPTAELLERVLGPSSRSALRRLARADLVEVRGERIRFRHPLYAEAVTSAASPVSRRALHARFADVVEDVEERARHLALATAEHDDAVALALEDAAAIAQARGAWESAGELLERASDLTSRDELDDFCRRRIAAARHWVHAGDRLHARTLLEGMLVTDLSRAQRGETLQLLAEISHHDENVTDAVRLLEEALEYADERRLVVTIELLLGYLRCHFMDWEGARQAVSSALEEAESLRDDGLLAQALALCAMTDYLSGNGIDWDKVERSRRLEDAHSLLPLSRRPILIAGLLLLFAGRHPEAREVLRALSATALERGDESDLAFVLLWLSWLDTRLGSFETALEAADDASSLALRNGSSVTHAWALTQKAYVSAHFGDVAETRRCCDEALAPVQQSGSPTPGLWLAASVALLELSLGNAEAAWRACEPMVEAIERFGLVEPVPVFFLPDAIEALIAIGELDRAQALLEMLEARGREFDRSWAIATAARCRGLFLAAGASDGAQDAFDDALAEHARIELPFDRARVLLCKGVVERRAGHRALARASLTEAGDEFERMGARLWAERARTELRRVPSRRSRETDGLTSTEEQVAALVSQGQSNKEVAQALFVTEKTVEANLTRIYRKLGVRSRSALAARLAEPRAEETSAKA